MKIVHDAKKRIVILLWCLAVSLFLWYFAITTKPEIEFFQFINFCIVLFGGGFAYHVVTELVSCPYNETNSYQWTRIYRALLVVYVGYLIAGGSLTLGKYLQIKLSDNTVGWLVAFLGLIIGMFWSMHFLFKLEHPIRELLASKLEDTGEAVKMVGKETSNRPRLGASHVGRSSPKKLMKVLRLYLLELLVIIAGISVSAGTYLVFGWALRVSKDELTYVSVASAGMLFIIGHVYSRLKDRRDVRRKRAQELFLEWHSKDLRDSRIFVSRWCDVHRDKELPTLGALETDAAEAYRDRYREREAAEAFRKRYQGRPIADNKGPEATIQKPLELDDAELKELHFFNIYQFFERWELLVRNSDIDHAVASDYMSSYKSWYLEHFIEPWAKGEDNKYIKPRLDDILKNVTPSR